VIGGDEMKLEELDRLRNNLRKRYKKDQILNHFIINRMEDRFEMLLEGRLETFLRHCEPEELWELCGGGPKK